MNWLVKIRTPITTSSPPDVELDGVVVLPDPCGRGEELVDRDRREQERDAEAERVDRQQLHPFADGVLATPQSPGCQPRIGPMHGVQPNANATPTSIAPRGPAGLRCAWTRFSFSSSRDAEKPHRVQAEDDEQDAGDLGRAAAAAACRNLPMTLAVAPSAMKTSEKPSTNKSEATSTLLAARRGRRAPCRACRRASRPR